MSSLRFVVTDVVPDPYALSPLLLAKIHISESTDAVIHAMVLRSQVRIAPQRRRYDARADGLSDLFGPRERWGSTLKPILWMHASTAVQGFRGDIDIDLPLPCTYDFDVAATKYLHAVREGAIPLSLLFSGTVFVRGTNGFQVEQIPWSAEAEFLMPARVWRETMDRYFPNSGWIRLPVETLDALDRFRTDLGLIDWDDTVSALLEAVPPSVPSTGISLVAPPQEGE